MNKIMDNDIIDNIALLIGLSITGFVLIVLGSAIDNVLFGLIGGMFLILPIFKLIFTVINEIKESM
jgi:hypothetical protein